MNLVLFEPGELGAPLPRADLRAVHILTVLRRAAGDAFNAGVVNGPIGSATLESVDDRELRFVFTPARQPPSLPDITLVVGMPRPPTARDILRDATTMGVRAIHFVSTERTHEGFATSSLWRDDEWRKLLVQGAAQACDTQLPIVTWTHSLIGALAKAPPGDWLALDNYEASGHLSAWKPAAENTPIVLAIGPERGWGPRDRERLRAAGGTLLHLGARVLRVEMAVVAALALLQARR
ncbi:ribosomal RNA small subunit methyltransferase E 1 [Deltaproteobacteria bacterium]|nr:ribosomal RNA small subunit methyltransferase E 1 [Deltaproteobacteria bacterium]